MTPGEPVRSEVGCSVGVLAALLIGCHRPVFIDVSNSPRSAHEASLAAFSDGLVLAWHDMRDGHGEIYARALNEDGTTNGPARRLTAGVHDAFEADLHAYGDTDFLVAWYEKTTFGAVVPHLGRWSRGGEKQWVIELAPSGRNTVARVDGALIFAAWIEDEGENGAGVWAGWWNGAGQRAAAPRRIGDASRTTWNLNAAIDPRSTPDEPHAWVVFDATRMDAANEVFALHVGRLSAETVRLTPADGVPSRYPDIAFSRDRVAITWFDTTDDNEDVLLATGRAAQLLQSDALADSRLTRVTATPGHSIGAYLAWNGDRLGLSWCDDTVGQSEVYIRSFDPDGKPLGDAIRVTATPAASLIPAIEAWRGGFALAWNEWVAAGPGHDQEGRGQVVVRIAR